MTWIIISVWLICAIIAAQMYKDRGYGIGWGFLVGFLLGPLGLIYAATRPKKQ